MRLELTTVKVYRGCVSSMGPVIEALLERNGLEKKTKKPSFAI